MTIGRISSASMRPPAYSASAAQSCGRRPVERRSFEPLRCRKSSGPVVTQTTMPASR